MFRGGRNSRSFASQLRLCITVVVLYSQWFAFYGPPPNSLTQLFESRRMGVGLRKGRIMCKLLFLAVIWTIWKERNQWCFKGRSVDYLQLVERVRFTVASWSAPLSPFQNIPMISVFSNWKVVAFSNPVNLCIAPAYVAIISD